MGMTNQDASLPSVTSEDAKVKMVKKVTSEIQDKGFIKEGFDADFTIVDLNKVIEIKNENIESKCGWSPFDGYKFKGTPVATIINGEIKMKNGKLLGYPSGKPILFK